MAGIDAKSRALVLEAIDALLDEPDVQVAWSNSIVRTTQPGDQWETYEAGRGRKVTIEVPCGKGEYHSTREFLL